MMYYHIYTLKFSGGYHFGTFGARADLSASRLCLSADTLVAALLKSCFLFGGQSAGKKLLWALQNGDILLSDTFPFYEDSARQNHYFLPKPCAPLPLCQAKSKETIAIVNHFNRKIRQLSYIPVKYFAQYIDILEKYRQYQYPDINDPALAWLHQNDGQFGYCQTLSTLINCQNDARQPYILEKTFLKPKHGAYFIIASKEPTIPTILKDGIDCLSSSGLGGKKSVGCGKVDIFHVKNIRTEEALLQKWLQVSTSKCYLLLSSLIPHGEDNITALSSGQYKIAFRSGFTNQRKHANYSIIESGSCLSERLAGSIIDVSATTTPSYRYGKGLYLGWEATQC